MSRVINGRRTNVNEELVMSINEAMDYCNNYYCWYYMDEDDGYNEEEDKKDAKTLLAIQDRVIDLMKKATFEELELAFPLDTDTFDDTDVYDCVLSTTQNVLEYIRQREDYNNDLEVFMRLRTQARIVLGEF